MSFYLKNTEITNPKAIPTLYNKINNNLNKTANVNKNLTIIAYQKRNTHTFRRKKAFCRHPLTGSMTVEAAIAVPLLFFAWIAFVSLISTVRVYEKVQCALSEMAVKLAVEAGKEEEIPAGTWLQRVWLELESIEDIESGGVREVSAFDFSGSRVFEGNHWICLSVRYRIQLLEGLIPLPALQMKNRVYLRAWTGYDPGEGYGEGEHTESSVCVTDSGAVYHENRMCSHIKLSIYIVDGKQAEKYPPCEKCVGGHMGQGKTFYLTESGTCYHNRLSCSGLKRSVRYIGREEAISNGYVPCQRCGGE